MDANTCRYELISEEIVVEDNRVTAYGFCMLREGQETLRYSNISVCRQAVADLVDRLNKMDAQSVHLDDIVEDFLP